ncbi:hypothetical protein O7621_20010 [Solwaraspora sp. WMMD937]|uniref:hypothetical protein n=1 Tax=Solwaraspora sp. WMMD937 TaxID=3016090 RepID=UPI00249CB15A|nr:hypothetical protein [Solwaraspora sp. WMMD937]WFE20173.1 hypothetical protein O7621_20010 [Solwaraspora sp. WMMD937]
MSQPEEQREKSAKTDEVLARNSPLDTGTGPGAVLADTDVRPEPAGTQTRADSDDPVSSIEPPD